MRKSIISRFLCGAVAIALICVLSGFAAAASQPHYLVTNDDALFGNSVTFYTIGTNGLLILKSQVPTSGSGIGGGYFAANRVNVINGTTGQCVYAADAATGDITGINVTTLLVGASATGSSTDGGTSNGIGLATNGQYIYASFSDSNTIGTFQIQSDCSLTFVNDTSVVGLQAGIINGMAAHGNILVVTYGDGSIESFNISSGTPVSNGDEQNSAGYLKSQGATYPTGVEITLDGHFALFGDTSTSSVVEVSDLSSGHLGTTVVNTLGTGINSSNILLSPDETLLYISNTQGDRISAAFFNKNTGKLSIGCASNRLRGYVSNWSYLAGLALATNSGTGGMVYVAEFGTSSGVALIQVSSANGKCSMAELSNSPLVDANSPGLLSIGTFPPRSF